MADIEQILARVDNVLADNRRTEYLYMGMTIGLFFAGIGCLVTAIATGQFFWSAPPVVTTSLLYYPMQQIKELRQKNIALGTAPLLISTLPTDQAAVEMGRLLSSLYGTEQR